MSNPTNNIKRVARWVKRTPPQEVASQLVNARRWKKKYIKLLEDTQALAERNEELKLRIAALESLQPFTSPMPKLMQFDEGTCNCWEPWGATIPRYCPVHGTAEMSVWS